MNLDFYPGQPVVCIRDYNVPRFFKGFEIKAGEKFIVKYATGEDDGVWIALVEKPCDCGNYCMRYKASYFKPIDPAGMKELRGLLNPKPVVKKTPERIKEDA